MARIRCRLAGWCLLGEGEVCLVESVEADAEGCGVGREACGGWVEDGVQVSGCETALDHAEVVLDWPGNVFVCCDESLGDKEGEFWVGCGELNRAWILASSVPFLRLSRESSAASLSDDTHAGKRARGELT